MPLWLSRPLYALIPWFYGLAGVVLLAAFFYLEPGRWKALALVTGCGCLAGASLVGWLRRR